MKISTKITIASAALVVLSTAAFLTTVLIQRGKLGTRIESLVREQSRNEAGKIVETIYLNCAGSEIRNLDLVEHNLSIAREVLHRAGPMALDDKIVEWKAINQLTKEARVVQLPKCLTGSTWLGQNADPSQPSPVVDEVRHLTRAHCTIFQRMNDAGDMLRVTTTVVSTNGNRAVGTFIPHEGSAVIEAVLKGETYRGRAFVVDEHYTTAYEPIWNGDKSRVIGMLYVGVSMTKINKELHDGITKITVGKTGYVYVLDSKGRYIVSRNGERDGESIWETKDTDGRYIIQSIVAKGKATAGGALTNETYNWKNAGEKTPRAKFAVLTYFAPWDWVIAAGAYEDDYQAIGAQVNSAMSNLVKYSSLTALAVGLLSLVVSYFISMGISRPITRIIDQLNCGAAETAAAASQIASASQSLAEGSSRQASSIEETSASVEELSSMTRKNSENAQKGKSLAKQSCDAAELGATDIKAMAAAMEDIKTSSDDIVKIIKIIDGIAFQTNILALNAAVEAARAGEAGMGFAVVADEVRGLAQRSAQAARETATKIEGAMDKTHQGVTICHKVMATLNEIVTKARESDQLAAEVASASHEQTTGLGQINSAINELNQITQSSAANTEESAATAEELSAQAAILKQSVTELSRIVGETADEPAARIADKIPTKKVQTVKGTLPTPPSRKTAPASVDEGVMMDF